MCNVSPAVVINANNRMGGRRVSDHSHSVAGSIVVSANYRGKEYSRVIPVSQLRQYYGMALKKVL